MKQNLLCWMVAIVMLCGLLWAEEASAAEREPFGIALSWTGDPSSSITVTWRDSERVQGSLQVISEMQYEKTGFEDALSFSAVCRDISLDGSGAWHYEAMATGLKPGTVYLYRVGDEENRSKVYRCITEDASETGASFIYMGDIQPVDSAAQEYSLWGELAQAAQKRNPELAFGILGGDIVSSGISLEQFDLFRESAEPVFSSIPLFATNGNHESNFPDTGKPELYLDVFAFPENGPDGFSEEFYSFTYANCHVLVLNSWIFSGEQKLTDADMKRVNDWIRADLAVDSSDWQVVVTHVPVYAVHSDTTASAVQKNWEPIFEDFGVDLVFEGHQHVYSRSYPMYNDRVDYEKGIPYIIGVAGRKFYDSADETFAERTIYNTATYQLIRTDGNEMTVQTLDVAGNELDFVSVTRRGVTASRGDYVEALWCAAGCPDAAGVPFRDTKAVSAAWAYEKGIVKGYGEGRFGPADPVTGWQRDLILSRLEL